MFEFTLTNQDKRDGHWYIIDFSAYQRDSLLWSSLKFVT